MLATLEAVDRVRDLAARHPSVACVVCLQVAEEPCVLVRRTVCDAVSLGDNSKFQNQNDMPRCLHTYCRRCTSCSRCPICNVFFNNEVAVDKNSSSHRINNSRRYEYTATRSFLLASIISQLTKVLSAANVCCNSNSNSNSNSNASDKGIECMNSELDEDCKVNGSKAEVIHAVTAISSTISITHATDSTTAAISNAIMSLKSISQIEGDHKESPAKRKRPNNDEGLSDEIDDTCSSQTTICIHNSQNSRNSMISNCISSNNSVGSNFENNKSLTSTSPNAFRQLPNNVVPLPPAHVLPIHVPQTGQNRSGMRVSDLFIMKHKLLSSTKVVSSSADSYACPTQAEEGGETSSDVAEGLSAFPLVHDSGDGDSASTRCNSYESIVVDDDNNPDNGRDNLDGGLVMDHRRCNRDDRGNCVNNGDSSDTSLNSGDDDNDSGDRNIEYECEEMTDEMIDQFREADEQNRRAAAVAAAAALENETDMDETDVDDPEEDIENPNPIVEETNIGEEEEVDWVERYIHAHTQVSQASPAGLAAKPIAHHVSMDTNNTEASPSQLSPQYSVRSSGAANEESSMVTESSPILTITKIFAFAPMVARSTTFDVSPAARNKMTTIRGGDEDTCGHSDSYVLLSSSSAGSQTNFNAYSSTCNTTYDENQENFVLSAAEKPTTVLSPSNNIHYNNSISKSSKNHSGINDGSHLEEIPDEGGTHAANIASTSVPKFTAAVLTTEETPIDENSESNDDDNNINLYDSDLSDDDEDHRFHHHHHQNRQAQQRSTYLYRDRDGNGGDEDSRLSCGTSDASLASDLRQIEETDLGLRNIIDNAHRR